MAVSLVIVKKEFNGEEWSNTYGITTDPSGAPGFPSDVQIQAAIGSGPLNATNTNAQEPGYAEAVSILRAIVAFERFITSLVVLFKSIYMTDGRNRQANPGQDNAFFVQSLGFNGLAANNNSNNLAPGGVSMMVNRNPVGFSQRQGRAFYRGVLLDTDVSFNGARLLGWTSTTEENNIKNLVESGVDESLLNAFMIPYGGEAPPWYLGIPHYIPAGAAPGGYSAGDLHTVTPVTSLVPNKPTLRQVARGRKRTP